MQNIAQVGAAGPVFARHFKAIKDIKPPVASPGAITLLLPEALLNTRLTFNNDGFIR